MKTGDELLAEAMKERWLEYMAGMTAAWEPLVEAMRAAAQSICEWAVAAIRTLEEAGYVFSPACAEAEDGREKEEGEESLGAIPS